MEDLYSQYPSRVRAGTQRPDSVYVLKTGFYAEHNREPAAPAPGAHTILNDGAIAVFQGDPADKKRLLTSVKLSPVYELQPGGSPAVPTGLVFLRFREGVDAASRQQDIERAGYAVAQTLPYAANAAWVRARSGSISDSLAGISKLEHLRDIENVEPQMLIESVSRS